MRLADTFIQSDILSVHAFPRIEPMTLVLLYRNEYLPYTYTGSVLFSCGYTYCWE